MAIIYYIDNKRCNDTTSLEDKEKLNSCTLHVTQYITYICSFQADHFIQIVPEQLQCLISSSICIPGTGESVMHIVHSRLT